MSTMTRTISTESTNISDGKMEDKEFDASIHFGCWLCFAPCTLGLLPYKTTLYLDNEEVTKTDIDCCGQNVSRRPYSELGSVDRANCCCCVSLESSFGSISPGCGCDAGAVDDMAAQLNDRMLLLSRGASTRREQIERAEQTLSRLDDMETKLDMIMEHLNIAIVPMKMNDRDDGDRHDEKLS